MEGRAPRKVYRPICSPRSFDSSKNACGSFSAMARNAETGVSRSALTDFTTGTSVADRASRENSLKLGLTMRKIRPTRLPRLAVHYRGDAKTTRNSHEILR